MGDIAEVTPKKPTARPDLEPLLREVLGRRLRLLRLERGERLVETAARAGISPQYLSEIERGLKEPSSEMVAAIAGALRVRLVDLTIAISHELRADEHRAPQTLHAVSASTFSVSVDAALYAVAA